MSDDFSFHCDQLVWNMGVQVAHFKKNIRLQRTFFVCAADDTGAVSEQ